MSDQQVDPNAWHIVGDLQHLKAQLGLKYRSLCGLELRLRADAPYPTGDAGDCPACMAVTGVTEMSGFTLYKAQHSPKKGQ